MLPLLSLLGLVSEPVAREHSFLDRLLARARSGFGATEGGGRPTLPLLLGSVGEPVVGESLFLDSNLLSVFLSLTAPGPG